MDLKVFWLTQNPHDCHEMIVSHQFLISKKEKNEADAEADCHENKPVNRGLFCWMMTEKYQANF